MIIKINFKLFNLNEVLLIKDLIFAIIINFNHYFIILFNYFIIIKLIINLNYYFNLINLLNLILTPF